MPRQQPRSVQEQAQQEFSTEFDAAMEHLIAEAEPAPGTERVSRPREVALWGQRDPSVDPAALEEMLATTGAPQEVAEALVVVQENPDLLMAYAQPAPDPETLDALVILAEFPFRLGLLAAIEDPKERVAAADALNREWQKQFDSGDGAPEAVSAPPMTAPSAPLPPDAATMMESAP